METILKEITGIFDGEHMCVGDGNRIMIPPNYAAKSMLIVGDVLIYRITEDGSDYFKQKEKMATKKALARMEMDEGELKAKAIVDGRTIKFNILRVYKTYYDLKQGSQVVIVFPERLRENEAKYAAIENKIA
jgi:hypothetical protein